MQYWFNPIYDKTPQGASKKNTLVTYSLKIAKQINTSACVFNYCPDGSNEVIKQPMLRSSSETDDYKVSIKFTSAGLYWYYFEVYQGDHMFYLQPDQNYDVQPTGELTSKFQQTVYEKDFNIDPNFNKGIMYHVFVDRFCKYGKVNARQGLILRDDWGGKLDKNSSDFKVINKECFGGNIKGIISKLDYLKKLNVSCIYLSPICEANSYHKYNTADYKKIDSMFGSEKDFKDLISKAKDKGMGVIIDGVYNHTGDDSIYFNRYNTYKSVGACQSKNSPYYNWYEFMSYPQEYTSWWGIKSLPQIKKGCESFEKFLTNKNGVIAKYLNLGVMGFRLDVVDELKNSTLEKINNCAKKLKKDCVLLGEVWEDASNKIAYEERKNYFTNSQLNSVMNYPLKDAILNFVLNKDVNGFKQTLYMLLDHYPKQVLNNLMNILSTHDTPRLISVLKQKYVDKITTFKAFKISTLLQFFMPGVPCVFYGDEAGVQGGEAPFCRVCMPWGNIDKTTLNWYKKLSKFKTDQLVAYDGIRLIISNNALLVLERMVGDKSIILAINVGDETVKCTLNLKNYNNYETNKKAINTFNLSPLSYKIFIK